MRRWARRTPLVGATVVVVAVGVTGGMLAQEHARSAFSVSSHAGLAPAGPSTPDVSSLSLQLGPDGFAAPGWLPAGVAFAHQRLLFGTWDSWYSLPGRANERTVPVTGFTRDNYNKVHLQTGLEIRISSVNPPLTSYPAHEKYWVVQDTTVAGHPAWFVTPDTGYGNTSVIWSDGVRTLSVGCMKGKTADGDSGVSLADMRRVAESMYR